MAMRTFALALRALMMMRFAVAACGDDDDAADAGGAPSPAAAVAAAPAEQAMASPGMGAATVKMGKHAQLGDILVDDGGRTLYRFTNDGPNTSNCNGACAQTWPPLTVSGTAVVGEGISAGLGAIDRADGTRQVTYNGQPLYRYVADTAPGDAKGQGVGNSWWVVTPAGATAAPAPSGTADPDYGY